MLFSSTSSNMAIHFENYASRVIKDYLKSSAPFVVEIGCNDGIMLRFFSKVRIQHLRIEPSANVVKAERIRNF
jgi:methylation protein EvaC